MNCIIPCDPLGSIFTSDVIKRLQRRLSQPFQDDNDRHRLLIRLNILTAAGEISPYLSYWRQRSIRAWKAYRAAWDTYLFAAYACGLFSEKSGTDLINRLTDTNNDNFQGALAECLACWLFAGKFRMPLIPRPKGSKNHELEFVLDSKLGKLHVEVKAPYRAPPTDSWSGDDSDKIMNCLETANKQFRKDNRNILVLVPSLRLPLYNERGSLIRAFYGEERFVMSFDPKKAQAIGPATIEFFPKGRFLQFHKSKGKPMFTRTSLVVSVEEIFNETYSFVDHKILILHNPHAIKTCEGLYLGNFPEFKREENYMKWSDGHQLFP